MQRTVVAWFILGSALAGEPVGVVGYRGDGTNRYGEATPPTAWDLGDGTNVAWFTPLVWGRAAPIVVGDRLFLTEEPHVLVCLDRAGGAVRWRREANVLELVAPEAMTRDAELAATCTTARARELVLGRRRDERRARLRDLGWEAERIDAHLAAILEKRLDADKARFDLLRERGGVLWSVCRFSAKACGPWGGHAMGTPVSDGVHVWVKFGTGVTACYDLAGGRRWMVATPLVMAEGAECSSPLLVDGLLVQQLAHEQERKRWLKFDRVYLLALDAATGEERWRADAKDYRPSTTPVVLRLPHPGGSLAVIVTGSGTVVRARDGRVLGELPGDHDDYGGITVVGDVIYRSSPAHHNAVRMAATDDGTVTGELLWERVSGAHASGLAWHDGVLTGLKGAGSCHGIEHFDAASGELLPWPENRGVKNVGALRWAAIWIPPTVTRDHVYLVDRGTQGWRKPFDHAAVTVLQRGRGGRFVAHNALPRSIDTPLVPDGDRLYARTDEGLFCFAHNDEAGRTFELVTAARLLLADLRPGPPPARDPLAVAAVDLGEVAAEPLVPGYRRFLKRPFTPALPADGADAAALLARQAGWFDAGELALADGRSTTAAPLEGLVAALVMRRGHEVLDQRALGDAPGQVRFTNEALAVDAAGTWRVDFDAGNRAWLSGVEIRPDDRVALAAGTHALLFQAVAGEGANHLEVRFEPSADVGSEQAAWIAAVRRNLAVLEAVAARAPDTDEGRAATALLDELRGMPEVPITEPGSAAPPPQP